MGAGTQYFANQVLNPCRGGNRGGTRGGNQGTNTRFFLGNNNPVGNGLLGFPWWVRSGCGYPLRSWEPMWLNTIIFIDIFKASASTGLSELFYIYGNQDGFEQNS